MPKQLVEAARAIFWYSFWKILPFLLRTTRDVVDLLYKAAEEAEDHAEWSGDEKRNYVIDKTYEALETFKGVPRWVLNTIIEVSHGYMDWKESK